MDVPRQPRYKRSVEISHAFLMIEGICDFPVDPFRVIKKHKWGVIKYSELAQIHSVSVEDVCCSFGSTDGFTIFDKNNYTIAYNDTVENRERTFFTLMHEIGHIYLNHLIDFDEAVMMRQKMTTATYKVLETETNVFARNVMAPAPVVKNLQEISAVFISNSFFMSMQAATVRYEYLENDLYYLPAEAKESQIFRFTKFIAEIQNTWFCSDCYHTFVCKEPAHCPICGSESLYNYGGAGRYMHYEGFNLDENGYPDKCPICGNEEIDGPFCKICGTQIQNKCTYVERDFNGEIEYECNHPAAGNARFCTACGAPTTYNAQGILKPWDEEQPVLKKFKMLYE